MLIIPNSTQEMVEDLLRVKEYSIKELANDLRLSQQTLRRIQRGTAVSDRVKMAVLQMYLEYLTSL